jgi:uncharacterized protein YciI
MGKQFQVLTIVRLLVPDKPAPDTPEDDKIQAAHLAYLGSLMERGIIIVNGPVRKHDDPKFLGMSIYRVGLEEAKRLAMDDPGAKAGWFEPHADTWLVPSNPVTLGDQMDLEV